MAPGVLSMLQSRGTHQSSYSAMNKQRSFDWIKAKLTVLAPSYNAVLWKEQSRLRYLVSLSGIVKIPRVDES